MTKRKRMYIIIFASGFILLLSGFGSSYFWLTRIYLPEQIDANVYAKKLMEWTEQDTFTPPADQRITRRQLHQFLQVNESLAFLMSRLHDQFEDNSWRFAFEIIQMQPEWTASKYLALKKHGLSPREYDWIFDQVVVFIIHRWKEEAMNKIRQYGWKFSQTEIDAQKTAANHRLFVDNENDLRRMFVFFWPEKFSAKKTLADSL